MSRNPNTKTTTTPLKKKDYDLTTGPILNRLLLVSIPIVGTQLMQMLYNLADMFWLGRVGADAVASSGTAGMYLWLSQAILMFGRMGAEIGTAQFLGRRKPNTARSYAQTSFLMGLGLGVLFGLAMVVLRVPLIGFFGIQDIAVARQAEQYLAITGAAIPFTYITGALTGAFNGAGNTRTPFFINAVGLVLNMALDPILIFTLDMGVAGAAIATSAAQGLVAVLFLIAIKRDKNRPFEQFRFFIKPLKEHVVQIVRWCTPIALESLLFCFLSMVISRLVAGFGTDAMAVQRVGGQIESLSWLVGGGFASAVTAFIGQNYGAGRWSRVRRGIRISQWVMVVWGVLITLLLLLAGRYVFALFLNDDSVLDTGTVYLRILALCQIAACLEYNSAGVLRGMGKTIPPSLVSIAGNIIRVPIIYFLGQTALGLNGIWWGISIGAVIRSVAMFVWFCFINAKLPRQDEERGTIN